MVAHFQSQTDPPRQYITAIPSCQTIIGLPGQESMNQAPCKILQKLSSDLRTVIRNLDGPLDVQYHRFIQKFN
jgi:hypothetical protein